MAGNGQGSWEELIEDLGVNPQVEVALHAISENNQEVLVVAVITSAVFFFSSR